MNQLTAYLQDLAFDPKASREDTEQLTEAVSQIKIGQDAIVHLKAIVADNTPETLANCEYFLREIGGL